MSETKSEKRTTRGLVQFAVDLDRDTWVIFCVASQLTQFCSRPNDEIVAKACKAFAAESKVAQGASF
jgi:hypothetical protein